MENKTWSSRDWRVLLSFLSLWTITTVAINPIGDFPLNDDWGFAVPIKYYLSSGTYQMAYAQGMPLVVQLFWGALFCLPLGFSFTALRISSLTAGLGAIAFTYALSRELGLGRGYAALATVTVAANPMFICHANSFMTEVPFNALVMGSLWLLARAMRTGSGSALVGGMVAAFAATFIRQTGVFILVAYALTTLLRDGWRARSWLLGLATSVFGFAALGLFERAMAQAGLLPGLYHVKMETLRSGLHKLLVLDFAHLGTVALRAATTMGYFSLWLLPVVLAVATSRVSVRPQVRQAWTGRVILFVGASSVTAFLANADLLMPWLGNTLYDFGVGLNSFLRSSTPAPRAVWVVATFLSLLSAGYVIGRWLIAIGGSVRGLGEEIGPGRRWYDACLLVVGRWRTASVAHWSATLLGVVLLLSFAPIFIMEAQLYDRYVTPYVSVAVVALLSVMTAQRARPSRLGLAIGGTWAAVFLAFGIFATHDMLRLNESRWTMLEEFERETRVHYSDIDGGYEYNNYRLYVRPFPSQRSAAKEPTYYVTLSVEDGDEIIRQQPSRTWMPFSSRQVYLVNPQ